MMAAEDDKVDSVQTYLIITADDFGYSVPRDDGIVECYKRGAISNVSLMVNGYSAESAVQKAKLSGLPMGLHLNLTEGSTLSGSPSLVGDDGFMLGKLGFREAVKQETVKPADIKAEIQCQIEKFRELTGYTPVNVDGHQHVHTIPGVGEIFAEVLQDNGICLTRLPIEADVKTYQFDQEFRKTFLVEVVQQSIAMKSLFHQHGISAPLFIGLNLMGQDMTIAKLQHFIKDTFQGHAADNKKQNGSRLVCELMVHPGNMTGNCGGCGSGPDIFSQSHDREHEMRILSSQEMSNFYKTMNIKLTCFKSCKLFMS